MVGCPPPFSGTHNLRPPPTPATISPVSSSPTLAADDAIDPRTGRAPFTRVERVLLTLISRATTIAVRVIGPTMRVAVSCDPNSPVSLEQRPFVYSFWHQCTFA